MSLTRFVAGFDPHGNQQDAGANNAFFRFCRDFKPKYKIAGGDIWDFAAWRQKASKKEQEETTEPDFKAGMEWLDSFRPTHLLLGNHDIRIFEAAAGKTATGPARDYAAGLVRQIEDFVASSKCVMFPYHKRDGVLKIGHLKVLHGFFAGKDAVRQTAKIYGSCLMGHIHAIDEASEPGLDRRVARACGCLCKVDMDYNSKSPNTLRYANGWAYGTIDEKTGEYQVFQAENINGRYYVASEVKAIA